MLRHPLGWDQSTTELDRQEQVAQDPVGREARGLALALRLATAVRPAASIEPMLSTPSRRCTSRRQR